MINTKGPPANLVWRVRVPPTRPSPMASRRLMPGLVIVYAIFVYLSFMVFVLAPRSRRFHDLLGGGTAYGYAAYGNEYIATAIVFHALVGLFAWSYALAATLSPGRVPLATAEQSHRWRDGAFGIPARSEAAIRLLTADLRGALGDAAKRLVRSLLFVDRKKKLGLHRFCHFCNVFKPDRCHHCRVCEQCTLRMDHHCPWLNNCVGYNNYKHFVLAVLYGSCACFFVATVSTPTALTLFRNREAVCGRGLCAAFSFMYLSAFLAAGTLAALFWFHAYLAASAMSTIEYREKKNSDDVYVRRRFQVARLKYDRGTLLNLEDAFGPMWLWPIPLFSGHGGTYERVDDDVNQSGSAPKPSAAAVARKKPSRLLV